MNTPPRIEHIGILVSHPQAMAKWYQEVLGFIPHIVREDEGRGVAFMTDAHAAMLFEFGKVPHAAPLAARLDNPLQLHLAFISADPDEDAAWLVEKGATFLERCATAPEDHVVILKDPWGNTLQLAKRGKPLI